MDALARRTELENARLKNDIKTYRLEMCGKRITLAKTGYKRCTSNYPVRGVVTEFSRRARARRLRRIAEINWQEASPGLFVTVTYPDAVADHTMEERKVHRYLLNRSICQYVGRQLGMIWRVEWLSRKSGEVIGQLRPHMHLLYMKTPIIGTTWLRRRWMEILRTKTYTQVDVKPLKVADMVACYVSKYCSKEANATYLDNVPKRNRSGRHAGELRRRLIPSHEKHVIHAVNDAIVRFLKGRACDTLWWFDPRFDEGFTVLGSQALELVKDLHENYLDIIKVIA